MSLSPKAARVRRLMVQHENQALTETFRQRRLDQLDDSSTTSPDDDSAIRRCTAGAWVLATSCPLCSNRCPDFPAPNRGFP